MNKELEFYINPEGIACISLKEYNDLLEKYVLYIWSQSAMFCYDIFSHLLFLLS